jgi:hypothetical protein
MLTGRLAREITGQRIRRSIVSLMPPPTKLDMLISPAPFIPPIELNRDLLRFAGGRVQIYLFQNT